MLDPLIRERLELNGRDSEKVLVEFRTALRVFAGRYIGQHTHDGRSLTKYYRPATVFRKLKFEEALREAEHDAPRPTAVSTRALEKTRGLEDPEEQ